MALELHVWYKDSQPDDRRALSVLGARIVREEALAGELKFEVVEVPDPTCGHNDQFVNSDGLVQCRDCGHVFRD